jgi:peroxiredoxin
MRRRLLLAALAVFGAGGAIPAELAGQQAPDFALKGVDGHNYRLSEYRGRVVLVSFWASWCGDCRAQLERISALYERYAGSGLEMLAVGLDPGFDQLSDAARALDVAFPALHDAGGEVGRQYDVRRMPYLVLIDQAGVVRQEFAGFNRGEESVYLDEARALLTH